MKLSQEFIKLPFTFDVEQLTKDIASFDEADWAPHHENFKGNFAIPLLSVNGTKNNFFAGPIKTTQALKTIPYTQQVPRHLRRSAPFRSSSR